jgi:thiamine-phosphate pyrophosphorylase
MEESLLLHRIEMALKEELAALQIWDHFREEQNVIQLVEKICLLCHAKNIPVLVNNKWELLKNTSLDGVHFDQIPENFEVIKQEVKRSFISGLTCNNDLSYVLWANENQLDYISFCSIFPSTTANSCELVNFDTIREARKISALPIFLAGGIKPGNIKELNGLDYTGIAVVSGIMSSDKPDEAIRTYYENLNIRK